MLGASPPQWSTNPSTEGRTYVGGRKEAFAGVQHLGAVLPLRGLPFLHDGGLVMPPVRQRCTDERNHERVHDNCNLTASGADGDRRQLAVLIRQGSFVGITIGWKPRLVRACEGNGPSDSPSSRHTLPWRQRWTLTEVRKANTGVQAPMSSALRNTGRLQCHTMFLASTHISVQFMNSAKHDASGIAHANMVMKPNCIAISQKSSYVPG